MSDQNDNNNSTIRPDSFGNGNKNKNDGQTIRPSSGGGSNSDSTIRPSSGGGSGSDSTIRPSSNGGSNNGSTIRPSSGGGSNNGSTIRPNSNGGSNNGSTIRPNSNGGSTIRPNNGGSGGSSGDSTLRPSGSAKPSGGEGKTTRQDNDNSTKGVAGSAGAASGIAQADKQAVADVTRTYEDSYTLNGIRYKVKKVISEGTGEAVVLLVENGGNEYVLKLYYPGISPNHPILDKVKSVRAMNLFVATVDHGVWCLADNKNGKDVTDADRSVRRDYELMLYYPYGSLDKVDVRGNEKKITEFFANMAMSINLCHVKGFLHRDVKPGNFLFVDKAQSSVVLGDFGIAVDLGPRGVATTNQARTKVYAAPESYLSTEGEVDITPKSDFYSLGMTLICLWMGEEQFAKQVSQSERALASMKTYGKLPYPTNMSDHMLSLVMALTAPDPEARPTFEQLKEWISGKDPFLAFLGKKQEQEEKEKGFEVLFNGARNLVAHSPEELAQLMLADPQLGIKYLYSGRVGKWMDELAGLPEVMLDIEDIVESKYPSDKQAGLYAACLILDPDMPYTDVAGKRLRTATEIADSLLSNFSAYKQRLASPNNKLYIYLSMSGQEALAKKAVADFKNSNVSDNEALRRLIYQLDPSRPFIVWNKAGKPLLCASPDDVIRFSANATFDQESMRSLYGDAFFYWLGARNQGLVARVKKALADLPAKSTIRFLTVLFNLNPKVSYYMSLDPTSSDYVFTITQLAELFNKQMDIYQHEPQNSDRWKRADDNLTDFNNIDDTLLYAYLKSKDGRYDQWIDWIRDCTNVSKKEHQQKAGPYNWRIGTYKAIRGMGVTPYYRFPKSDKKITDPSELGEIPDDEVLEEMQHGMLKDWLAVFYQEDPSIRYDKLPRFSYEEKCEEYTNKVGDLDPDNETYQDFAEAQGQVLEMARKLKSTRAQLITLRAIVAVFCFLPIAGLIIMLIDNGLPWTENPLPGWHSGSIMTMTIIFGVLAAFSGDMFDDGCLAGIIGSAIGGFICALIVYYAFYLALAFIMPFASYVVIALLLLLGWFIYSSCYRKPSLNIRQNSALFSPGFEETVLEPLDYAYNRSDKDFDSSIYDTSNDYLTTLKEGRKKLFFRAIPISLVTALLLFFFIQFTYGTGDFLNFSLDGGQDSEAFQAYKGQWNGTFDGRNATIDVYDCDGKGNLWAVVHVKYRSLLQEMVEGHLDTSLGEIFFDDKVENNRLDGSYHGSVTEEDGVMLYVGTYTNKKSGKQVSFEFRKSTEAQENAPGTIEIVNRYKAQQEGTSQDSKATSAPAQSRKTQEQPATTPKPTSEQPAEERPKPEQVQDDEPAGTGYSIDDAGSTGGGGFKLEDINPDDVPVDIQ